MSDRRFGGFWRRFVPDTITEFTGPYRFLSNFWVQPFEYKGIVFGSAEHAYQGAKARKHQDFLKVYNAKTPGEAKRIARTLPLSEDWNRLRLPLMWDILKVKFAYGTDLAQKLLDTGDAELIEGNTWGDEFWGVCNGVGTNHLGVLLMKQRERLRE